MNNDNDLNLHSMTKCRSGSATVLLTATLICSLLYLENRNITIFFA